MRALSADEIKAIAGGLSASSATVTLSEVHVTAPHVSVPPVVTVTPTVPASSGGSGGSSAANPSALTADVMEFVNKSETFKSEVNSLISSGFTIVYGVDPNASTLDATTDGKTIYILPKYESLPAQTTAELLAHEVYHALHGVDYNAGDYSSKSSYLSTVMNNEGASQVNAIQIAEQIGDGFKPPGQKDDVSIELDLYDADQLDHPDDPSVAVKDIAEYMQDHVKVGTGQTYGEYYSSSYDKAHPK